MLSKIKAITNNRILSAFDHKIIRKSVFENPVSERIDQRKIIFFHPPKCGEPLWQLHSMADSVKIE